MLLGNNMRPSQSEISLYVDTMIVEALLSDEGLSKSAQAGIASSLATTVESYFSAHVDPDDKTKSIVNLLAPGVVWKTLSAIGLPWWFNILVGLLMSVFHVDVYDILDSIGRKLSEMILSGHQFTSSQVDEIVHSTVQEHAKTPTPEEAQEAASKLRSRSHMRDLRDAKLFKLAMIEYSQTGMISTAQGWGRGKTTTQQSFFDWFSTKQTKHITFLSRVLSWIFKVGLASAGFMIAGDVINAFLHRPSALTGTFQHGKPVETSPGAAAIPEHVSTQTKFPVNPSYHGENLNRTVAWAVPIHNDPSSIENMLVEFAKQVYQGLDGQEENIKSTPSFKVVADAIEFFNYTSTGASFIFIPRMFHSRKEIVDKFIDDVAEKAS